MSNFDATAKAANVSSAIAEPAQDQAVYVQRFSVTYEFPVYFTQNLFAPENPILHQALSRREPGLRHRCMFFVDEGLTLAHPTLLGDIANYANRHAKIMELVAAPFVVVGGEVMWLSQCGIAECGCGSCSYRGIQLVVAVSVVSASDALR